MASALRPEFLEVQRAWLEGRAGEQPEQVDRRDLPPPDVLHQPGRNNPAQRAAWLPVLERYGVDLVLQGHDHSYGRGNMVAGTTTADRHGTMYVVSVSGPKMYERRRPPTGSRTVPSPTQDRLTTPSCYQVICVDGDKLAYKAKTATGRLTTSSRSQAAGQGRRSITENLANVKPAGVGGIGRRARSRSPSTARRPRRLHPGRRQGLRGGRPGDGHQHGGRRHALDRRSVDDRAGKLVNGTFSLAQPLQAAVSSAFGRGQRLAAGAARLQRPGLQRPVTIRFKQSIGANEALRTGAYAKSLTLTLSTTTP